MAGKRTPQGEQARQDLRWGQAERRYVPESRQGPIPGTFYVLNCQRAEAKEVSTEMINKVVNEWRKDTE